MKPVSQRQAKRLTIAAWCLVALYFGMIGFCLNVLPGIVRARTAAGLPTAAWIVQVTIDAADTYPRIRFTVFPFLLVVAVWWTIRLRKASRG